MGLAPVMSRAQVVQVVLDGRVVSPRYFPLSVERCGDIDVEVMKLVRGPVLKRTLMPVTFVMAVGTRPEVVELLASSVGDATLVSLNMDVERLEKLLSALRAHGDLEEFGYREDVQFKHDCRDMVVEYRVYGRGEENDAQWVQYLRGPLTFLCCSETDDAPLDPKIKARGPSTATPEVDGPFMTKSGFNPAFMSARDEEGD